MTTFVVVQFGARIGLVFGPKRRPLACVTTLDRRTWLAADPEAVRAEGVPVSGDVWALLKTLPPPPQPYAAALAVAACERILDARRRLDVTAAKAVMDQLTPFMDLACSGSNHSAK